MNQNSQFYRKTFVITSYLGKLIPFLVYYRYWLILPIAVVEGPIISVIAGFLVFQGDLKLDLVFPVLVIGDLIGDSICYWIGRFSSAGLVERYGHFVGVTSSRLEKAGKYISKNTLKTFLFGKFAHGLGYLTWIATGAVKVPFSKFISINTITTIIKSAILLAVGYFFGQAYLTLNKYFNYVSGILIILFLLFWIAALKTSVIARTVAKIDI